MGWVRFFSGERTTSIQRQPWRLGEMIISFPCHKLHPTSSSHGLVAVLTELIWCVVFINMKPFLTQKLLSTRLHFWALQDTVNTIVFWIVLIRLYHALLTALLAPRICSCRRWSWWCRSSTWWCSLQTDFMITKWWTSLTQSSRNLSVMM